MSISRIYRLLRVITLLQGRRYYTAQQLAEELDVSRRTIFRDLNMLELARIPYYYDELSGGYRINDHFFLPPVNLTLPEALAVMTMAGGLRAGRVPLLSQAAKAAAKIESMLPPAIRRHVGSVVEHLTVSLGPTSRHEGLESLFQDLTDAIAQRRICRVVYISFQDRKQFSAVINPLRLVFKGRAWYLLAFSPSHRQVRSFKLGRMRKLTVTERTFSPIEVDLDEHFGHAWSMIPEGRLWDVHLHFEPMVAGNVAEVLWHRSQQVQWNDDGSLEFSARVDGLGEITWWILGYGDQVRVVSPPELRQKVAQIASAVAAKYPAEAN